jgi:hypothetical protein
MVTNIFHHALRKILRPLHDAGKLGLPMASGDGIVHRGHPILAAHAGDYMENFLVVGCKMGKCSRCSVSIGKLGSFDEDSPIRNIAKVLDALKKFDTAPLQFPEACCKAGIKQIPHPYWQDLPYCNIFTAIPPDILHQLYQGLVKHVITWIKTAFNQHEIDARCRRLPPNHHLRHFAKGITTLKRLTGQEHSDIARILLGLIIDMRLPDGSSTIRIVKAVRAMLDFLYLAQYPVQSTDTLRLLHNALERFHHNKQVFVDLGIREDFELPKLHFVKHYVALIKSLGTPDNYNTEYTERLHIDYAKNAYAATNHRDEFSQMTIWLGQKEKILRHDKHIQWCLSGKPLIRINQTFDSTPPPHVRMTKHPSQRAVPLETVASDYSAPFIYNALVCFITRHLNPSSTRGQFTTYANNIDLPLRTLAIYHKAHFSLWDPSHHRLTSNEDDLVHAIPAQINRRGKTIPGRFDTVLVNLGTGSEVHSSNARLHSES